MNTATKLREISLESRDFLIQRYDIFSEFWSIIPRLRGTEKLKYLTNPQVFKEELFQSLKLNETSKIQPYILTTNDHKAEYIGSMLVFPEQSPEHFQDPQNELIRQQLENQKYPFITCLQVREDLRVGTKYGMEIFSNTIADILKEYEQFRGVISDKRLATYYNYFGIDIINDMNNPDGVSIGIWNGKNFKKRA